MERYINCIAYGGSEGNLLVGEDFTALFDCGMAFCANDTIQNVKNALADRPLDYVFITHTHYDHVGALPFFRKEWPQLRLVTSEIGAAILVKDTPRRVIREFSVSAAKSHGVTYDINYSDNDFHAEIVVKDKDIIPLGGLSVEVLETPGHTRDSLCYFIPELALLILNETPGVLLSDGSICPCYLTSYSDTIHSIEKCLRIRYKYLSLPHRGIVNNNDADGFLNKTLAVNAACRDFILGMNEKNLDKNDILDLFCQKYSSELLLRYQPKEAFIVNARATIACTLREFASG